MTVLFEEVVKAYMCVTVFLLAAKDGDDEGFRNEVAWPSLFFKGEWIERSNVYPTTVNSWYNYLITGDS